MKNQGEFIVVVQVLLRFRSAFTLFSDYMFVLTVNICISRVSWYLHEFIFDFYS